jgi:hypothetical protein
MSGSPSTGMAGATADTEADTAADTAAAAFIARWRSASGSELANAQLFVIELCELLGVERPPPAQASAVDNAYAFERAISFQHPDGSTSPGRIDLYRRGCFVLESKKVKLGPATQGFDEALMKARAQAEAYARALPAGEGRPPFVVVVDVGHVIELYAEFTRSGGTYTAFPDPRQHRIRLEQLADAAQRERLRTLWLDPMALDPARLSARVTREVRPSWRSWRATWRPKATPPSAWRPSSRAACSACLPKTSACCPRWPVPAARPAPSCTCCAPTRPSPRRCARCCACCGPTWTAAASAAPSPSPCCASTASCSRAGRKTTTCCR